MVLACEADPVELTLVAKVPQTTGSMAETKRTSPRGRAAADDDLNTKAREVGTGARVPLGPLPSARMAHPWVPPDPDEEPAEEARRLGSMCCRE